jgi:Tol biopolymer transport system component
VLTAGPSGLKEATGLWVISTLTGELRKLLDDVDSAAFSPDASEIAYIGGSQREIWIMAADGGRRRLLAAGSPNRRLAEIIWMPDGRSVAYSSRVPAGDPTIQTRRVKDGQWTVLMTVPRLRQFCVTRDGRLLYTQADQPPAQNTYGLWSVQIEPQTGRASGDRRRLTRWTGLAPDEISIASDGSRAVVTLGRTQQDVYVGDLAAEGAEVTNIRRLTHSSADDTPAGWLTDSRTVLLGSDRNGTFDLFTQRLADPDAAVRVTGPGDTRDAQVSPDGSWLLYLESQAAGSEGAGNPARLMRTPLAGGSAELVLETDRAATISPFLCPRTANAPCVLYERDGTHDVFTAFSPTGGRGREVARAGRKSARWALSHDGSLLAYMPVAQTAAPMTVFTTATGASRQIDAGDLDRTRGFDWIATGRALLFMQGTLRQTNVYLVPLDGKPQSVLTLPPNAGSPMVSPDGKHVAYSRYTTERNAWLLEAARRSTAPVRGIREPRPRS